MITRMRGAPRVFLALLVWCLASLGGLCYAQSKVRTVLMADPVGAPSFDTDQRVEFVFRTASLPANATVTGATLQLVASGLLDNADTRIDAYVKTSGAAWDLFGSRTFAMDSPRPNDRVNWRASDRAAWFANFRGGGPTSVTLALVPSAAQAGIRTRQWHSTTASEAVLRPRLILDYTLPGWTEPRHAVGLVGVESPNAVVPTLGGDGTKTTLGGEVSVFRLAVPSIRSYTPAFGHGLVYVVTGSSPSTSVEARLPLTGDPVWAESAYGAGRHIVLTPSNRLHVVGNGWIYTYVIDGSDPRARPKPRITISGQPMFGTRRIGLESAIPPASGPDGSLFLVEGGRLVAFDPDLVEAWSVQLADSRIGPITVDPSGRFLYLTSAADGLLAFDAQTGQRHAIALANQQVLRSFDAPALHAPVVVRMDDDTRGIFAATSSGTDGSLTFVKNGMMRAIAPAATLETDVVPLTGLWSQVLPQPDSTAQGRLPGVLGMSRTAGAVSGASELVLVRDGGAATRMPGPVLPQGAWSTAGRPVVDARGAVHLWNGQQAYVVRNALTGAAVDFQFPQTGRAPNARLMFGSDGTLYAHDPDDLALYLVLPQVVLNNQPDAAIRAPMHVAIRGQGGKGTIVTAHGAVSLLPGTTLAAGTQLHTGRP